MSVLVTFFSSHWIYMSIISLSHIKATKDTLCKILSMQMHETVIFSANTTRQKLQEENASVSIISDLEIRSRSIKKGYHRIHMFERFYIYVVFSEKATNTHECWSFCNGWPHVKIFWQSLTMKKTHIFHISEKQFPEFWTASENKKINKLSIPSTKYKTYNAMKFYHVTTIKHLILKKKKEKKILAQNHTITNSQSTVYAQAQSSIQKIPHV